MSPAATLPLSRRRCGITTQKWHSTAATTVWLPTVPFQRMQNAFWHRADDYSWNWVQDRNPPYENYLPMRDLRSGLHAMTWLERRVYSAQVSCHERVAFPPDENCRAPYAEKTSWIIPRKRLASGHGIDP